VLQIFRRAAPILVPVALAIIFGCGKASGAEPDAGFPAWGHELPFSGTEFTIGDSISNNPNVPKGTDQFIDWLARLDSRETFTNLALPGVKTAYMISHETPLVTPGCSLITIDPGANDYDQLPGNETPWATYTAEVSQLVAILHGTCPTATIALLTFVNDYPATDVRYGWFNRANAFIRTLRTGRPYVVIVDLAADSRFSPLPGTPYMYNALHENGAGQAPMAQDIDYALTAAVGHRLRR
jgi:hypothetical protein